MTEPTTADLAALQRRRFLRGGALLAAATGGALAATAGSVLPASAADDTSVPISFGVPPERLRDTTKTAGRGAIVGSSRSAFDSSHRLKKGAYVDVAVLPAEAQDDVIAVYVNLTSLKSTASGSLVVSEPSDDKPSGSTVSYDKGKTVSNNAIVGLAVVGDALAVRIWATSVTHLTLDVTGLSAFVSNDPGEPVLAAANRAARAKVARTLGSAR